MIEADTRDPQAQSTLPLRFGLVGCSRIARKHAAALQRIPDAKLLAVCDLQEERSGALGREFGVASYAGYDEMLTQEQLDVVTVLTPSGHHADHVRDLVRYKRHLVVEKPLALRLEDADEMIRACDQAGVKLFVVKQNRYNRPIQALRKSLEEGRFGRLILGTVRVRWSRSQAYYDASGWRGTWAWDGGVLTNQASHHIDMLEWLMGDVVSVKAMTATRLFDIEVEDTAVALLRFQNGALGVIEATTATRPEDLEGSVSILGEGGTVVVGGFAMNKLETWKFCEARPEDETIFATHGENPSDFAWNHTEYLRGVVHSIRTGGKALVDGLEGRRSLELINALYESSETGKEVALRFQPKRCRLGVRQHG